MNVVQVITLNILLNVLQVAGSDYCALTCLVNGQTVENSACKCDKTSACGSDSKDFLPDKAAIELILKSHNDLREKVAAGQTDLPAGTNIRALAYDANLEYVAKCWNSRCTFGHDQCRRTEKFELVGQNAYMSMGTPCEDHNQFAKALDSWATEISQVDATCLQAYTGCAGHFTQAIWAETTHIGCARVFYSSTCQVICNYGPGGNMLRAAVYKQDAHTCEKDANYPHLCKGEGSIGDGGSDSGGGGGGGGVGGVGGGSITQPRRVSISLPIFSFLLMLERYA